MVICDRCGEKRRERGEDSECTGEERLNPEREAHEAPIVP
jgi:hypothetical protein